MLQLVRAAFFDLDKTIIARASMVAFGKPFYKEGLISRRLLVRALWGQLVYLQLGASEEKLTKVREQALRLTKGWDQARIQQIVRETLDDVVQPIVFSEALELIDFHHGRGDRVYVVSASPVEIVIPISEYLGADGAIATRAGLDDEGRYTGETEFYAYGPFKAEAMRALAEREDIDLSECSAYSDSYTDLPMLEAVGHPVVVNPDKVLARIADERGWEARVFGKQVRLRDRLPVPRTKTSILATAGGAAVAAGGVAFAVAFRGRRGS